MNIRSSPALSLRRLRATAGGFFLVLAASAAPVICQFGTHGLVVRLEVGGISWSLVESSAQGGGPGLQLGYGLNNLVTLQVVLTAAAVYSEVGSGYALAHLDAGTQFHVRSA